MKNSPPSELTNGSFSNSSLTPSMFQPSTDSVSEALSLTNLIFLILFSVDLLLRLVHDGCYDFWFDALSLVDIIVVLLDWLLMLSENQQAAKLLGSGRVFKALRILRIVRMARTTRAAIALQQDFRRPLAYRDLFALEILENEFKHLETELREDREDWRLGDCSEGSFSPTSSFRFD